MAEEKEDTLGYGRVKVDEKHEDEDTVEEKALPITSVTMAFCRVEKRRVSVKQEN